MPRGTTKVFNLLLKRIIVRERVGRGRKRKRTNGQIMPKTHKGFESTALLPIAKTFNKRTKYANNKK